MSGLVIISMMLMWYGRVWVIVEYDRRRSRPCIAAIKRKYDNYSCHRDI